MGSDGPSDEEAPAPPSSCPYHHRATYPRNKRSHERDREKSTFDDAPPPPPPPPPPPRTTIDDHDDYRAAVSPPPPPLPSSSPRHDRAIRSSRGGRRHRGGDYPVAIEVPAHRSSRTKKTTTTSIGRIGLNSRHNRDYDYSSGDEEREVRGTSAAMIEQSHRRRRGPVPSPARGLNNNHYESFPAPEAEVSFSNFSETSRGDESSQPGAITARRRGRRRPPPMSRLDISHGDELQPGEITAHHRGRRLPLPPPSPSPMVEAPDGGTVLVHYHPQMGDDGIESTLLDRSTDDDVVAPPPNDNDGAEREHDLSRVERAMAAAGTRRSARSTKRDRGAASRGGMHARMIDDAREEELHRSESWGAGPSSSGNDAGAEGRIWRNRALRSRRLRDADADVGGAPPGGNRDREGCDEADAGVVLPPGPSPGGGGYRSFARRSGGDSSAGIADEGDMPFLPRTTQQLPRSPDEDAGDDEGESAGAERAPPPLPSPPRAPSYRSIVRDLIATNEPENLAQIDRVMEKYSGREEELIKKLDSRYRRKKAKNESVRGRTMAAAGDGLPVERPAVEKDPAAAARSPGMKVVVEKDEAVSADPNRPLDHETIERLTSPAKITFLKVQPVTAPNKKSAIMAMQSWDRSEERELDASDSRGNGARGDGADSEEDPVVTPPPRILKKALPAMITDSTRTDLHCNHAIMASVNSEENDSGVIPNNVPAGSGTEDVRLSSKTDVHTNTSFSLMNGDDDNSGMIPLGNYVQKLDNDDDNSGMIPNVPRVHSDVENLGNQVMKERLARGKQRERLVAHAAAPATMTSHGKPEEGSEEITARAPEKETIDASSTPRNSPKFRVPTAESPDDDRHNLRSANSYGDGISVITIETKSTLERKRRGGDGAVQRLGANGEAVYSFDEMLKRPPNSITCEDTSGSFENKGGSGAKSSKEGGAVAESKPPKIQRIVPEVETEEDRAMAAETTAKLDNVEARIRARRMEREDRLREEIKTREEEARRKAEEGNARSEDALMVADDELDSVASLFRAHKSRKEDVGRIDRESGSEEVGAALSGALTEADNDARGRVDDQSRSEDIADIPSRALMEAAADDAVRKEPVARDPSLTEDLLLRDPSAQLFSHSTLRYPSFKESPSRGEAEKAEDDAEMDEEEEGAKEEEGAEAANDLVNESFLSSFDEEDRKSVFVGERKRPSSDVAERQRSEDTDVRHNTSFGDVDDEEKLTTLFVGSISKLEQPTDAKRGTSFIGEKAQQLRSFVDRVKPQQQWQQSEEMEAKRNVSDIDEKAQEKSTSIIEEAACHNDAGDDNNTVSTLGSRSYIESFWGRSKPYQQKRQQLEETEALQNTPVVEEKAEQPADAIDVAKAEQVSKRADEAVHYAHQPDAGDDSITTSTVHSRHSAHSAAEKAIAAATRSELQRQREVQEYQRQWGEAAAQSNAAPSNASVGGKASPMQSSGRSASSSAGNEIWEEEIARLMAEKESRFQAEKAVALMKAQRELEQERKARLEAEAAMLKAEEELQRLKLKKMETKETISQEPRSVPPSPPVVIDYYSGMESDSVASPEAGTLKSEKMTKEKAVEKKLISSEKMGHNKDLPRELNDLPRCPMTRALSEATAEREGRTAGSPKLTNSIDTVQIEAEFTRLKAEQELERLKLEKMAKEAEFARIKAEEELERLKLEKAAKEAEAARVRAEEELEQLKIEKTTREEFNQESRNVPRKPHDRTYSALGDNTNRLQAQSARMKAEKQLERIKSSKLGGSHDKEEEDSHEPEIKWRNSECEDSVEKFRHYYSSSDGDNGDQDDDTSTKSPRLNQEVEDSTLKDDVVEANAYETIEDDDENDLTTKRQVMSDGREEESTSQKQVWFSGEEEESIDRGQGWFGFLRRKEKQQNYDVGVACEEAKPREVNEAVLSDESDHSEEIRKSNLQMESSSESSKDIAEIEDDCIVVADEKDGEDIELSSHPNEESQSNLSSHCGEDPPESYPPLNDESDSTRSSSPELDEPPNITRRSFSDDEGENNMRGGLFMKDGSRKLDEHDTASTTMTHTPVGHDFASTTMTHAPVGHDFPSMTMANESRVPTEYDPTSERAVADNESDKQVINDEHDSSSTPANHGPTSPVESDLSSKVDKAEPSSKPVEDDPVSRPENAERDNQPNNKAKKEDDDETHIHHVARRTFEGDRSKGQLSFITGSKIEAHSNQRGPWWLGRCGGRTGWFPASAVVPASEFLGSPISSPAWNVADAEHDMTPMSPDELNAVYDLIRNPSDPLGEDDDDSDDESTPARNRWVGGPGKIDAASSHDYSPPPSRVDPSEMAGLSERLYEFHDDGSRSNKNDFPRRPYSPVLSGVIVSERKSVARLHHPQEADETLSKEKPLQAQSQFTETKAGAATISPLSEQTRREVKAKANADTTTDTMSEWRAARDPNSGLVYYYHTGTRETTWERPPEYVPKRYKPPAKSRPRKPTNAHVVPVSKDKPKGGRRIMGFLSKMKKAKPEAETSGHAPKSPGVPTRSMKTERSDRLSKVESPHEVKPQAQISRQEEQKLTNAPGLKAEDVLNHAKEAIGADAEPPQKDFWTTLDDNESSSSDESENTEASEETQTSLFSKTMFKTTVGKWAGKITERLNSPPSTPYETLHDGTEQPHDTKDSPAHATLMINPSMSGKSNDELPSKAEIVKTRQIQTESNTKEEPAKMQIRSEIAVKEEVGKARLQSEQPLEKDVEEAQLQLGEEPAEEEVAETQTQSEASAEEVADVQTQSEESSTEVLETQPQSEKSAEEVADTLMQTQSEESSEEVVETQTQSEKFAEEVAETQTQSEESAREEVAHTLCQPKDAEEIGADDDEQLTIDENSNTQIDSKGASVVDRELIIEVIEGERREEIERTEEIGFPDKATKEVHAVNRKKTQWRSAIDAATGRTYYYSKDSQRVTWEKPSDL